MDPLMQSLPSMEHEAVDPTRSRIEELVRVQSILVQMRELAQPTQPPDDSYPIPMISPDRINQAEQQVIRALGDLVVHGEVQALPVNKTRRLPRLVNGTSWPYLGEYVGQQYFLDPTYQKVWIQTLEAFGI